MLRYLLFFSVLLLVSCKTQKKIDFDNYTKPYLIFQSGGGFAGTYNTYVLLDNGLIYKKDLDVISTDPVGRIDARTTKQLYRNYEVLNLDAIEHEKYGNYIYAIKKHTGNKTHQIIWQKGDEGTKTLQVYFKNAASIISKNITKPSQQDGVKQ